MRRNKNEETAGHSKECDVDLYQVSTQTDMIYSWMIQSKDN